MRKIKFSERGLLFVVCRDILTGTGGAPAKPGADQLMDLLEISQKIRSVRQAQNMTLEQLAAKSGFSKGFISQVENFRLTPSLKALDRISAALGTDLSGLFAHGGPEPEFSFGTLDSGEELLRDDNLRYGMRYLALAYPQIGRIMDPFLVEYTPSKEEREFKLHDSEEFFVLLEGKIEYLILNDAGKHSMKAGDTVYLKANLPHRVRLQAGCTHAKALIVYSSARNG